MGEDEKYYINIDNYYVQSVNILSYPEYVSGHNLEIGVSFNAYLIPKSDDGHYQLKLRYGGYSYDVPYYFDFIFVVELDIDGEIDNVEECVMTLLEKEEIEYAFNSVVTHIKSLSSLNSLYSLCELREKYMG